MTLNQRHRGLWDAADRAAMASRGRPHICARRRCRHRMRGSTDHQPRSGRAFNRPDTTVIVYDTFQKSGGYTLADYDAKWSTGFGLGEMALRTRASSTTERSRSPRRRSGSAPMPASSITPVRQPEPPGVRGAGGRIHHLLDRHRG